MSQDLVTFRNSVSGRGITRGEGGREGVSQGEMNYLGMTFPILSIVSHQISWKYDKRSFLSMRRKFLQAGKFALMIRISVYFLNIWPLYRLKSLNIQPLKGQIWSWCLG